MDAHPWASLDAALQEPPGDGDKNGHRTPSPALLLLLCVESTGCKQPLAPVRIPGLINNSRNSQSSSFQAVQKPNNGPQVERAPAPSPDQLCTCSPSTAPPPGNTQLSHHRPGWNPGHPAPPPCHATCFRADKSSPPSLQPSAASPEAAEVGSAFAIAPRMRCSHWEIGSGLFTATTASTAT